MIRTEVNGIDIEKLVEHLKKRISEVEKYEFIRKPVSYAMYKVWEYTDALESERELGEQDDTEKRR